MRFANTGWATLDVKQTLGPAAAASVMVLALGALAALTRQPLLFPSLAPTIFIQVHAPRAEAARPWNTLVGHGLGIVAAVLALLLIHGAHLVIAHRLASGWRVYGRVQAARLHQVVVLRDLGVPLKSIKVMLNDDAGGSLPAILSIQRRHLQQQQRRIERALNLIQSAQDEVDRSGSLSLDDLTALTRETTMSNRVTAFDKKLGDILAERDPSGDSMRRVEALRTRVEQAGMIDVLTGELKLVMSNAARLRKAGDIDSPEAQALVTHWRTLTAGLRSDINEDRSIIQSAYQEVVSQTPADKLPFDPADFEFLRTVSERMQQQEGRG